MRISSSASRTTAAFAVCACSFAASFDVGAHDLPDSRTEMSGVPAFGPASIRASSEVEVGRRVIDVEAEDSEARSFSPGWVSSSENSGGIQRWSLSRGAVDIAVHIPAAGADRGAEFRSGSAIGQTNFVLPAFSIGLKQSSGTPPTAGSLLARAGGGGGESSASRVGLEWKPDQAQVNFLREGLGFRLDGSDRMTVRLRKGVLGVYMHRKF